MFKIVFLLFALILCYNTYVIGGILSGGIGSLEIPDKVFNPYAQLSDTTNQVPGTTTSTLVTFNSQESIDGISHILGEGTITIQSTGTYLIIAAAQVAAVSPGVDIDVDMWLRVNDVDLINNGVRNRISATEETKVLIQNTGRRFFTGDVIKVYMKVGSLTGSPGFYAFNPVGQSLIPSIILTMSKVGD